MKLPSIKLCSKPTYIKLTQDINFLELFKKVEDKFENCFILESLGEESYLSRYSVIGFDPEQIISAKRDKLILDSQSGSKTYKVKNPYFTLGEIVPQNMISRLYAGGLVGYLSYDCINYFEPTLNVKKHDRFDQFRFGVYKDGLVYDKMTGEISYFYYDVNRIDIVKKFLLEKNSGSKAKLKVKLIGNTYTRKEHKDMVMKVKEDIKAGLIFQCVVGFKTEYEIKGNTLLIYESLRKVNPSPHMYYLKFGKQKVIGASPELLFRLRDAIMETFPLAGTIRRGKDEKEDRKLARRLLRDPKELAEHKMLVDLHRNDLGRVAKFRTVKLRNLLSIKKYSHVQHISSEISGIIREGEDMFSSLASNFPAGTLSGAPKIEAMKIIDKNEKDARGPYGGALGHFGFNGKCTFALPIRSLFISGNYGYAQTGGGIVYDSRPENEYKEILNKLAAISKVLSEFSKI